MTITKHSHLGRMSVAFFLFLSADICDTLLELCHLSFTVN
uniref:Uncharacterized protein n=1 Tax=Arundo donax TaxID=35708 RepID=A0A0A9BXN7_ARUDO